MRHSAESIFRYKLTSLAAYTIGFIFSYIFFVLLVFTAFGDSKKYWWIGILLIPAVIFELYFDSERIYIPIVAGLLGWLIGFAIYKVSSILRSS